MNSNPVFNVDLSWWTPDDFVDLLCESSEEERPDQKGTQTT